MLKLHTTSRGDLKENMKQAISLANRFECIIDIATGCDFHIEIKPYADIETEWNDYIARIEPYNIISKRR